MHLSYLISFLVTSFSLFHISLASNVVNEPGITCHGSVVCPGQSKWFDAIPKFLEVALDAVKPTGTLLYGNRTIYYRNDHVICRAHHALLGTVCLFIEGPIPKHGVSMEIIIERLAMLKEYGCLKCGSVPLSLDMEPKYGRVTVNFVAVPGCSFIHRTMCIAIPKKGPVYGGVENQRDRPGTPDEMERMRRLLEPDAYIDRLKKKLHAQIEATYALSKAGGDEKKAHAKVEAVWAQSKAKDEKKSVANEWTASDRWEAGDKGQYHW